MALRPKNPAAGGAGRAGKPARWSPEQRARRDAAEGRPERGAGNRADRRTERFGAAPDRGADRPQRAFRERPAARDERPARRDDAPRGEGRPDRPDRRPDWQPGPRNADRRPARDDRFGRPARPAGEGRPARSFERDDRGPRRFDRDERPRSFDRDDRPARPTGREDRPARSFDRDDRAPRSFDRAERPPRSVDRGERPARSFDRDDRAPRSFDRTDRPARSFDRADRPARSFDRPDRAPRTFPRSDRTDRTDRPRFERDDRRERPARDEPRWSPPEDVVLEKLAAEVVTADEIAGASFADLGLGARVTDALAELGASAPFPIQSATIPDALAGRDVLGRGRTGSGKTIAFGAAVVERLMRNWAESGRSGSGRRMGRAPRALVLAPTRELALQIDRTVQPIARSVGLYTTQIVGGVPFVRQVGALAKGVDIVVGTPGRIEDLQRQQRLDLSEIEIVVLDEADHMAELGFLEPMQRILRLVPEGGQRLMFSATLDTAVAGLVEEFLKDPAVHEVADSDEAPSVRHRVLVIGQGDKLPVLTALLGAGDRALVFARTRAFAEQLADDLDAAGVRAESLHGDLNQSRRTRNLAKFTEGKVSALVATDVAARGIHVDDIAMVVHADAAEDHKSYLHRSGRTGRAGATGDAVTLITDRRRRRFAELLDRAGVDADFVVLKPGEDPVEALAR